MRLLRSISIKEQVFKLIVYLVIVVAVVGTFVAAKIFPDQGDLWLNLFSESIGVAVTVFVIERLFRIEEDSRTRPARYAAFRDALLIHARLMSLLFDAIRSSQWFEREIHLLTEGGA